MAGNRWRRLGWLEREVGDAGENEGASWRRHERAGYLLEALRLSHSLWLAPPGIFNLYICPFNFDWLMRLTWVFEEITDSPLVDQTRRLIFRQVPTAKASTSLLWDFCESISNKIKYNYYCNYCNRVSWQFAIGPRI